MTDIRPEIASQGYRGGRLTVPQSYVLNHLHHLPAARLIPIPYSHRLKGRIPGDQMDMEVVDFDLLEPIFVVYSYNADITAVHRLLGAYYDDIAVFNPRRHAVPLHHESKGASILNVVDRYIPLDV